MKLYKLFLLPMLIALLVSPAYSQSGELPAQAQLKQLEWMLGTWQRTNVRPGTKAYEKWETAADGGFSGLGWSMKASDTTFVEKLKVTIEGNTLYYVADVKENATPTLFKITELNETGFVSRNPDHDFPKMISYDLKEDIMTVVISDGGEKKMGFVFKRLER